MFCLSIYIVLEKTITRDGFSRTDKNTSDLALPKVKIMYGKSGTRKVITGKYGKFIKIERFFHPISDQDFGWHNIVFMLA